MERKTALPKPTSDPADDLLVSRAIVRLSEVGSFSATARTLGVSVSAITRALQRAEERLGVALFLRSTHGISPTDAGRRYAAHLQRWLEEEESIRRSLGEEKRAERGSLRITMPVFVAEQLLTRVVCEFQKAYPQVQLDVHVSDDLRDVIKEGFDLALRMGPLSTSNLRMRALATFRRLVLASPGFVAEHGHPSSPRELDSLPCLLHGPSVLHQNDGEWRFWAPDGEVLSVRVCGSFRSNNLELLRQLCEAGRGITRLPDGAAVASLKRGTLVELFADYRCSPEEGRPTMYAVHAKDPGKDRLREALIALIKQHAPRMPETRFVGPQGAT